MLGLNNVTFSIIISSIMLIYFCIGFVVSSTKHEKRSICLIYRGFKAPSFFSWTFVPPSLPSSESSKKHIILTQWDDERCEWRFHMHYLFIMISQNLSSPSSPPPTFRWIVQSCVNLIFGSRSCRSRRPILVGDARCPSPSLPRKIYLTSYQVL